MLDHDPPFNTQQLAALVTPEVAINFGLRAIPVQEAICENLQQLGIFAHRARFLAKSMTLSSRPALLVRREQESWSYR
jgi:hypothetical protein